MHALEKTSGGQDTPQIAQDVKQSTGGLPAQNHTEACRMRIEVQLRTQGNRKQELVEGRVTEHIAKRMQRLIEEEEGQNQTGSGSKMIWKSQ